MFGFGKSLSRVFEDDPFFTGHREYMKGLNHNYNDVMNPFHASGRTHKEKRNSRNTGDVVAFNPFSMLNNFEAMFEDMDKRSNDPNCHSFSSSSVMSYTKTGDGAPKMYQASTQSRRAPGGIKETRRMERNSVSGVDKMAIGQHINDRGHIIQKIRGPGGNIEESHDYNNMDEGELSMFDQEWRDRTGRYYAGHKGHRGTGEIQPEQRDARRYNPRHKQIDKARHK